MQKSLISTLIAAIALATGAEAQQVPAAAPSREIVVEGRGQRQTSMDISGNFSAVPPQEQIARWRNWLCINVEGIVEDRAQYVRQRIADNARSIGLHVLPGRCTWNILIVFPADADAFTGSLVKDHPGLFQDLERKGFPGQTAIRTLLAPRAVRWLEVRRNITSPSSFASHIVVNTIGEKEAEIMIVDHDRLDHVTWQQLADYLSMAALTEPRLGKSFQGDDTILALFPEGGEGAAGTAGLTLRDRAVLRGYYSSHEDAQTLAQRVTIAQALERAKAAAGETKGSKKADLP